MANNVKLWLEIQNTSTQRCLLKVLCPASLLMGSRSIKDYGLTADGMLLSIIYYSIYKNNLKRADGYRTLSKQLMLSSRLCKCDKNLSLPWYWLQCKIESTETRGRLFLPYFCNASFFNYISTTSVKLFSPFSKNQLNFITEELINPYM